MIFDQLSNIVIGCAIEVHRELGPGLLESAYEQCLAAELSRSRIPFQVQVDLPVNYKGTRLDCGYRIDLLVDKQLIVELKSIEQLLKIHEAQILTYMRLAKVNVGLLMNFNVPVLKKGNEEPRRKQRGIRRNRPANRSKLRGINPIEIKRFLLS